VIPGTTPSAPDDTGEVDPVLAPLLTSGSTEEVGLALLGARLLVPVVAMKTEDDADMAVPALVNEAGKRALPVFSSYDALRAWNAEARPVPMSGARVMAAARAEGYDGVVLDVAGSRPFTFAIG
jgi:SseB protein N-terminal domain